jgi:hypothetical protein
MLEVTSTDTAEVLKVVATMLNDRKDAMRIEIVATDEKISAAAYALSEEPPVTTS